jgi:hypothetical protein
VLDEERVEGDPVATVDEVAQPILGLLGGAGPDDAEAVGDPVDMRVDGDRGDPVAEDEDAVRGLRPDPGQRGQLVERPRNVPREPVE